MGIFTCPLCCGQCFPDTDSLKKHLEKKLNNIKCPFCFLIIENVNQLPSHLDECGIKNEVEDDGDETAEFDAEVIDVHFEDDVNDLQDEDQTEVEHYEQEKTDDTNETAESIIIDNLQKNEMKIENTTEGEIEEENVEISPVEDVCEQVLNDNEENDDDEENVYHCSTCNAHFTDVDEHLATYHSDQQVYLQLPEGESKHVVVPSNDKDKFEIANMPTAANDDNDQAIWVNWNNVYYLSTRNPSYVKFQATHDLGYVLRQKQKNCGVTDLSPFYMEDEYGDKFFSVPVDTAIDYFEASHGRCGPKRFVGNFQRVLTKTFYKSGPKGRLTPVHIYDRIISTYQLSLTHILFSKMPSEQFVPIIEQIAKQDGSDEGTKYKLFWKCNDCSREMDTWIKHNCEDTDDLSELNELPENERSRYYSESEEPDLNIMNKENNEIEEYVISRNQKENFNQTNNSTKGNSSPIKHICKACNIIFFKDKYFFDHVKEKHSTPSNKKQDSVQMKNKLIIGKYYCQPCKLMFVNEKWLLKHHQTVHSQQQQQQQKQQSPVNKTIEEEEFIEDRTCTECKGIVFKSIAWYRLHRKSFHNDSVSAAYSKPLSSKQSNKSKNSGVHVSYDSSNIEQDEIIDDNAVLEPKILRTCALCVKVKNSIESLRKHMKNIHNDETINIIEEPNEKENHIIEDEQVLNEQSKENQKSKYNTRSKGVLNSNPLLNPVDESTETPPESEYDPNNDPATIKYLYKFKNDGLSLENVEKRYAEFKIIEIEYSEESHHCDICFADTLESQGKFIKHMELKHIHDICLESYFLLKRKLFKEARKRKKIEIVDPSNLPDDVRNLVRIGGEDSQTIVVDLNEEVIPKQENPEHEENEAAVENITSESFEENVDDPDAIDQPPTKKCKFEIIKADDLPISVRKKIGEHTKNTENTHLVKSISELLSLRQEMEEEQEDRTSKLTVEVMDFLNYKEKLETRLIKKAQGANQSKVDDSLLRTPRHCSVMDFNGDLSKSCMTCRVTFSTERWLERHKELFHKNCSTCPICSLLIQDHIMEVHMKGHTHPNEGNSIDFVCKECNNSFESEEHLNYHKLVHRNKVVIIQMEKCQDCMMEFSDAELLKNHMKVHSSRRVYTCNFCNKHFFVLADKVVHERIHTGVKPYACDECGKAFRKKFSLTMHLRHVHLNDRRYQCQICNAKFVTNSSLVVHLQRHDSTPRFKCKMCPKLFTNTGTRANHVRRKHYGTVEYICKHCTRIFFGMPALRKHYQKHESNELKYPCIHCPQVYGRSLFLNKHLKEAHGDFK